MDVRVYNSFEPLRKFLQDFYGRIIQMENEKKSNISFLKVMGTEETFFPNLLNFFQTLIHSESEEITETFTLFYPTSLEELKTAIVGFFSECGDASCF